MIMTAFDKIWVRQLGLLYYSQYMESHKIHVPNHQPVMNFFKFASLGLQGATPQYFQPVVLSQDSYITNHTYL
jgi:hypothetical protein